MPSGERIGLGITSVLTLVFLMDSINNKLPKVSYVKSIDIYLIGCFMYVFTVVIETVIAFRFHKRAMQKEEDQDLQQQLTEGKPEKITRARQSIHAISLDNNAFHVEEENGTEEKETLPVIDKEARKKRRSNIDAYCQVLFPLLFLLINTGYWVWLLALQPIT